VDLRRLRIEEWLTGIAGAILFIALFLPWYRSEVTGAKYTAWQAFGSLDVLLAFVALLALVVAVVTAVHPTAAVPMAGASLLALAGLPATALAISRVVTPPSLGGQVETLSGAPTRHVAHGVALEYGVWIGLGGVVLATVAALLSMRDQRFPDAIREATPLDIEKLPAPPREGGAEGTA
jgi:hypothetical protein